LSCCKIDSEIIRKKCICCSEQDNCISLEKFIHDKVNPLLREKYTIAERGWQSVEDEENPVYNTIIGYGSPLVEIIQEEFGLDEEISNEILIILFEYFNDDYWLSPKEKSMVHNFYIEDEYYEETEEYYAFNIALDNNLIYENTINDINELENLINNYDTKIENFLFKTIFVNSITILETYLCDTFIKSVFDNEDFKKNIISKIENIKLIDAYKSGFDNIIKQYIHSKVFHNCSEVKKIYKNIITDVTHENSVKSVTERRQLEKR
jgi:hypothetical protein